jgi:hypothetical protein
MELAMGEAMKIPVAALALPVLLLAGCSNLYVERKDSVTFGVGDAVARNSVQQVANPTPAGAQNTRIAYSGEMGARAVRQYIGAAPPPGGGLVIANGGNGGGEGAAAH